MGPITIDSPIEATTGVFLMAQNGRRRRRDDIQFVNDAVAINSRVQASSPILQLLRRGSQRQRGEHHAKSGKQVVLRLIFPTPGSFFPCSMRLRLAPVGK